MGIGTSPISRSPNDAAPPTTPSRVSAGPPRAPLKSVPRKPPAPEPADQNTLNMLGSNPLNDQGADLSGAPTGTAGFIMGSMASAAKGIQGLSTALPGFVPPEILMWVDNALQTIPQLLQSQQSTLASPQSAGTLGPGPSAAFSAPPVGGPSPGVGTAGAAM